nr:glutathione S-transferase [Saccharina japonica]
MPSSSLAVATAALLSLCSRTQAFVGVPSASAAAAVARGQQSALSMAAKPDQLPAQAKRYYVRPDRILDVLTSAPQLLLRLGSGALVDGYRFKVSKQEEGDEGEYAVVRALGLKVTERGNTWDRAQPRKPIEIYEFEGCPFCRKVREAVNILDLDVVFYPCPQDGPTFRPKANKLGGSKQFPYMVDPNSKTSMYESDDIINYLFETYGEGSKVPFQLSLGPLTTITAGLGMLPRALKGSKYTPAKMPKKPLELWGYESSPFTKVVREKLCELEIPHKFVAAARGSPKRQRLFEMAGAGQTPYLIDPNTGAKGYESSEIVDYLDETYAL